MKLNICKTGIKWQGYDEADPLGDLNSFRDQVRQEKGFLSTIPLEVKAILSYCEKRSKIGANNVDSKLNSLDK